MVTWSLYRPFMMPYLALLLGVNKYWLTELLYLVVFKSRHKRLRHRQRWSHAAIAFLGSLCANGLMNTVSLFTSHCLILFFCCVWFLDKISANLDLFMDNVISLVFKILGEAL